MTNDEIRKNDEIRSPKGQARSWPPVRHSSFGFLSSFACPTEVRRRRVIRHSSFDSMERILIVEDELPMRTALQDVLAAEGYRVLTAADGESGLHRALEEEPDLILLDIMMPKLDGYAVCAELRRLSKDRKSTRLNSSHSS